MARRHLQDADRVLLFCVAVMALTACFLSALLVAIACPFAMITTGLGR